MALLIVLFFNKRRSSQDILKLQNNKSFNFSAMFSNNIIIIFYDDRTQLK